MVIFGLCFLLIYWFSFGGGICLKLDVQGQGGGNILDVNGQGDGALQNWTMDVICESSPTSWRKIFLPLLFTCCHHRRNFKVTY